MEVLTKCENGLKSCKSAQYSVNTADRGLKCWYKIESEKAAENLFQENDEILIVSIRVCPSVISTQV